jgi:pSer/pThr/pTyr-binding forkhead associated (FHA) protein
LVPEVYEVGNVEGSVVSRQHARISTEHINNSLVVMLQDNESTNGVYNARTRTRIGEGRHEIACVQPFTIGDYGRFYLCKFEPVERD